MYSFTDERPVEEEEDLQQSVATIQRLENQCKILTDKNSMLTRQNQLFKQKLQQIAAANAAGSQSNSASQNSSQHYTVHEHAAVFKDTSSVPSMASLATGDDDDDQGSNTTIHSHSQFCSLLSFCRSYMIST